MSVVIDKSREYQRLEVVATIDALTGALNRGAIDAVLQRAWLGYSQTGRAGGVIMADIDHFKLINDRVLARGWRCGAPGLCQMAVDATAASDRC